MLAVQPSPDGSGSVRGRRVAIVGVGVVASCGIGQEAFWNGLNREPKEGVRSVEGLEESRLKELYGPKELRRLDRFSKIVAVASDEAINDAGGVEKWGVDPDRAGVWIGTGIGGLETLTAQAKVLLEKGARRVSPFLVPMMMANASAAGVSMKYGLRGPCENTVTACAAGTQSIVNAARLIATGRCDVVVSGSSEASLVELGVAGFRNMTALSSSDTSMPFDTNRDGFVIGEGGAILVLEEYSHAKARGAHIYGEVGGGASNADAYDITAPAPDGTGAASCMELALKDAELHASDIVHINAHGTSTPLNDLSEAQAIHKVFGTPGPWVTSTKGVTGHTLAGAGSIEAAAVALSIKHKRIPPTFGLKELDPEMHIRVVTGESRSWDPGPTLSNSFGFGGHNGCLVVLP